MYVVAVTFQVKPEHANEFREAVCRQAENSVNLEPECHRFDVCIDRDAPETFFLYEVYTDEAAFDDHRATAHYEAFFATVSDWLVGRSRSLYESIHHVPSLDAN